MPRSERYPTGSLLRDMFLGRKVQRLDGKYDDPFDLLLDRMNDKVADIQEAIGEKLGVREIMDYAKNRPIQLKVPGDSGGKGDALRHLLLSAELHRTHPAIADALLYGHEGINVFQGAGIDAISQDIFNNRLGRDIGRRAKSREEVERLAMEKLKSASILVREKE